MTKFTTLAELQAALVSMKIKETPELFSITEIGIVPASLLPKPVKGSTGKWSFILGNYRFGVKDANLTKDEFTLKSFTLVADKYKSMVKGDSFNIAE